MDWLDRMNRAMDYMETHLADEISYEEIARKACCSSYHFQRMFPFITGVPLSEYIRRRRLTLAAFDLQTADCKVIDVALKYGYESPESFTRAFKSLHRDQPDGGTPRRGVPESLSPHGLSTIDQRRYRDEISHRNQGSLRRIRDLRGNQHRPDKAFEEVPRFCRQCDADGSVDGMNAILGRFHDTSLHAALFDYTDTAFKYMICYNKPEGLDVPPRFTVLPVPASTWAVFPEPDSGRCGAVEPDLDGVVPDFRVRAGSRGRNSRCITVWPGIPWAKFGSPSAAGSLTPTENDRFTTIHPRAPGPGNFKSICF